MIAGQTYSTFPSFAPMATSGLSFAKKNRWDERGMPPRRKISRTEARNNFCHFLPGIFHVRLMSCFGDGAANSRVRITGAEQGMEGSWRETVVG